jgi:hypothetical protein
MNIGLSLAVCLDDILKGQVRLRDVRYIIIGVKARGRAQMQAVLDAQCKYCWPHHPKDKVARVFWRLYRDRKFRQPRLARLHINQRLPDSSGGRYWVHRRKDISWSA